MKEPRDYSPITRWSKFRSYVADIQLAMEETAVRRSAGSGGIARPTLPDLIATFGASFRDAIREYEIAGRPRRARTKDQKRASDLFEQLFGRPTPMDEENLYQALGGHRTFKAGGHPDNDAALLTVCEPLWEMLKRFGGKDEREASVQTALPHGDLLLIGGPHTTPLSMLAFELAADQNNTFYHRKDPSFELPFVKVIDSPFVGAGPVGRVLENAKGRGEHAFITTTRWAFKDSHNASWRRPGTREASKAEEYMMPREYHKKRILLSSDYLLITQLPNFLQGNPELIRGRKLEDWPRLTLMAGLHGLGTRGLELLLSDDGLQALETIAEKVMDGENVRPFQALAKVDEVELTPLGRFHRANRITIDSDDVRTLPFITEQQYWRAREFAEQQLPHIARHSSA